MNKKYKRAFFEFIVYFISVILLEIIVKDMYAQGKIKNSISIILITFLGFLITLKCVYYTKNLIKKYKQTNKKEVKEMINKIELISLLCIEIFGITFLYNFFFLMDFDLIPTLIFSATGIILFNAVYIVINTFIFRILSENKIKKIILMIVSIFLISMLITDIRTNIIAIILGTILTFVYLALHTKKVPVVSLIMYSGLLIYGATKDPYFGFEKVIVYMIAMLTFVLLENEIRKLIDKYFEYEEMIEN